jgi:serine/threonine protein phosphatase 1
MDRFEKMLELINFNENDNLYILGDVIDRGPDGIAILQKIMNIPNIHMLLGNHEYMMLGALNHPYDNCSSAKDNMDTWKINGYEPTINAFMKLTEYEREEIFNYLQNVPLNIDIEVNNQNFKLVHAAPIEAYDKFVPPFYRWSDKTPWGESVASFAVWEREAIYDYSIIGIDCGCAIQDDSYPNALGCLRLEDMQDFYVE